MKGISLELSNGHFDIVKGAEFAAYGGGMPLLCFEENGIMHVITNPDGGGLYDGQIVIPETARLENITIKLKCCSIMADELNAGIFELSMSESSAEFVNINARRINVSTGRSNLVMNAAPVISAEFKCGFGNVSIVLAKNKRGYFYTTECGKGQLIINSQQQKRKYSAGISGGIPIYVQCGLGTVDIRNN